MSMGKDYKSTTIKSATAACTARWSDHGWRELQTDVLYKRSVLLALNHIFGMTLSSSTGLSELELCVTVLTIAMYVVVAFGLVRLW